MLWQEHLKIEHLHHAYLLVGNKDIILPELYNIFASIGIEAKANPDFVSLGYDSLKIENTKDIKSLIQSKPIKDKKIFVVTTNHFLLEAQNALLKVFEEPNKDTHFFLIMPSKNTLLSTLISRLYVFETEKIALDSKAKEFLAMPLSLKLDFIKDLVKAEDEEEEEADSPRTKALDFLNQLEVALHNTQMSRGILDTEVFEHIFKTREFLRQPGSAPKMLLESVALLIPEKV